LRKINSKNLIEEFGLGGKDLTCLNGGKCKDHQCYCTEHFMGHDCSIGTRNLIQWIG
jgi:hypothetical protein